MHCRNPMKVKDLKAGYWLPRLLVIGFALSLVLPAPDFLKGLDDGQYVVWLARLIWVIIVPVVFGTVLAVVAVVRKKRGRDARRGTKGKVKSN